MRVAFFGSPPPALPSLRKILDAGHSVEIVVTQPDRPAGRGRKLTPSAVKAFAVEKGIPVVAPERIRRDEAAAETLRCARPDVNVVVAYGQIIPDSVIYLPRYHSLNVHFSLLPKYRGAAPVQWTVLNGDGTTGVTIIELNDKMDEGNILAREETAVGPRETAADLEGRLAEKGAALLLQTLDNLGRIVPVPQDHSRASLAPKIRKEDGRLLWSEMAEKVDRWVRALAQRPGVFTFLGGRRLEVHRGILLGEPTDRGPGEIVFADKRGIGVACGDGRIYLIEEIQPEGRGRMPARDYVRGARMSPGDRFSGSPGEGYSSSR